MKNARNSPSYPLIDIYGLIVKRRLRRFDNYRASTCRFYILRKSSSSTSPISKVTPPLLLPQPLDGSSSLRRRRARLRPPLLLTPQQWGLVKLVCSTLEEDLTLVNYSRLHPSTTLAEGEREKERKKENREWKHRGEGKERREMSEIRSNAILLSRKRL